MKMDPHITAKGMNYTQFKMFTKFSIFWLMPFTRKLT